MERHGLHERHAAIDTSNLRLLSRMDDFKVAKDSSDVRGWEVIARDGKRIGKVEHLLVDPGASTVRYLGVDVDRSLVPDLKRGDHLLVRVDTARLSHDGREKVLIPEKSTDLMSLPAYDQSSMQGFLGSGHARGESLPGRQGEERRITRSEEELAVGKRKVQAGEVGIEKKVETEHVRETVPVTRDEVTIERRPATGTGTGTTPRLHEDEIRIPLFHEEVVVEKRAVPKEELVVKKHEVTGKERIDETVRKERVEVAGEEHVRDVGKRRP